MPRLNNTARRAASRVPGAGGVRGSAAGAAHACDGPAGCSGSAVRQGVARAAAPDRHNPWSSRCCRGRSAGKGQPDGDRRRRRTSGRRSSSRPMRTRWTPAKSRTILRVWAVPGMARGVRRRPLPPSKSGRRRIVLSRSSVLPPIPLSGPRDRWPRAGCPLWISSPAPPDSSPVAAPGYLPTAPPSVDRRVGWTPIGVLTL